MQHPLISGLALGLVGAVVFRAVDCGKVVRAASQECDMSEKETWMGAGYRDGAYWSRAVAGKPGYALCLWKLSELPFRWQVKFIAHYSKAVALAYVRSVAANRLRMARADLRGRKEMAS